MLKRYQVFISSTLQDLQPARQEVSQALLRADSFPAGMELFPAADEEQFEFIKQVIDQSDYYIIISAGRYGSMHPDTGISFTEMEYDYAIEIGKPIIRLLHENPFNKLTGEFIEKSDAAREKLEAFRHKLAERNLVKYWTEHKELGQHVVLGLLDAQRRKPSSGWVRAPKKTNARNGSIENEEFVAAVHSSVRAFLGPNFKGRTFGMTAPENSDSSGEVTDNNDVFEAIGRLSGAIAHDFDKILSVISGHCDLLLRKHDPGDSSYSDIVQINQNTNRAASLVGQLLAFSRNQKLRPELLDFRDTLVDLMHLLNRLIGEKVSISLSSDPRLPFVRVDKRQMEQVIMNLVVNARDAMPDGGEIEIVVNNIFLAEPLQYYRDIVPEGNYVVMEVSDGGVGISDNIISKIFEPFFSSKGDAAGLGLSTVYGIVKQSGGYVSVESAVGKGSKFSILLPAHYAALAP